MIYKEGFCRAEGSCTLITQYIAISQEGLTKAQAKKKKKKEEK